MTKLFLDLDGVFAGFDEAFEPLFGFDHRSVPDEVMWDRINEYGSYFRDLPVLPGSLDFLAKVQHLNPQILTAAPRDDFENVVRQKIGWVREHLGPDIQVIPSPGGKSKPLYMHAPGDILVDDFEANVRRWRKAGGRAIHHTGDFAETYKELLWMNPHSPGTARVTPAEAVTRTQAMTTDTPTASRAESTPEPWEAKALRLYGRWGGRLLRY